jgi:DNA primase
MRRGLRARAGCRRMTGDFSDNLFARAKAVSIADVVAAHGGRLRGGDRRRGFCVLCRAGEQSGSGPFSVDVRAGLFKCWACGAAGDVVRFEQLAGGWGSPLVAARVLLGEGGGEAQRVRPVAPARGERPPANDVPMVDGAAVAAWMVANSVPGLATPVFDWIASRGLMPLAIGGAIDRLRWCPRAPVAAWFVREAADARRPPASVPVCGAMVAPLVLNDLQPAGAVHVTYLSPDGSRKADLRRRDGSPMPARKMFGSVKRACFPLTDLSLPGPLIVGEGIETVWAYAQTQSRDVRAVAVLSLDNLQGGVVLDDADAFRIDAPVPDGAKAPFTIPAAGDVIILVDADMNPVPATVRNGRRGKPERVRLTSLQRAELCGALAAQAWQRAGARSVTVVRPRLGHDFNDALKASGRAAR